MNLSFIFQLILLRFILSKNDNAVKNSKARANLRKTHIPSAWDQWKVLIVKKNQITTTSLYKRLILKKSTQDRIYRKILMTNNKWILKKGPTNLRLDLYRNL